MVSILVDADALITTISNSVPSSTVASSVTTASTNLSAAYSATTTSSIDASHTSSTPTKTLSSTSFTATTNNIPTTAPAVQNIASQITEVSQSTTFEKQVAVDGLLDSYSQTNEGDLDPYIKLLLASVYNIKWVNLAYGDQSVAYRKLNIYDGFGFSASYYISNALCTATPGSRKSKIQTQLCSRVGENDNVILLFLKLTFQV